MKVNRVISSFICILLAFGIFTSRAQCEIYRIASRNWIILADSEQSVLTMEYEGLGVVAKSVRLNLKRGDGLLPLSNWKVRAGIENLFIHTAEPETDWQFNLGNDAIRVVCSSSEGVITAIAPADRGRIPARIADPAGKPVDWNGTSEVNNRYGGIQTRNKSTLPLENPDILYLSLGQVSGRNLHCLFDRKTNTVVEFPERTLMLRSIEDHDLMVVTMPVPGNTAVRIIPDYYTKTLGLPYYEPVDDSSFDKAPLVWNSWTFFYSEVTEDNIVKNADWIADNLKEYGPVYVVLDDGCERGAEGEHYWIHNWDEKKFPHGGKWLAQYIRSKGLLPGLWLVPNAYAGAVKEHPEWYIRDKKGNIILDYNTPALDCTNPEVLEFLRHLFTTLKDWGFEYYKFDGEFALTTYIPSVDREKLFDKSVSQLEAYRSRLKVIRESTGKETFIEACPAGTPLNGIGYFNSYFNGEDIYNSWLGMYPFFASLNSNLFLNHIVSYVMPGEGICISPESSIEKAKSVINHSFYHVVTTRERKAVSIGTSMNEARTIATFSALSGATYSMADNMPDLPEDRVKLLKMTLPTMPIVPIDLFSRGSYMHWDLWEEFTPDEYKHDFPAVIDLKVNAVSGIYDVVAVTNWSSGNITRSLSFQNNLGLDPKETYLVFDFWNQRLEGVFENEFETLVEPHDTRVFVIRPLQNRPQLLATNRHITSAFSIEKLSWNPSEQVLRGSSRTMLDQPYSLYFHIPKGESLARIDSNTQILYRKINNGLLEVAFRGRKEVVEWALVFSKEGGSR